MTEGAQWVLVDWGQSPTGPGRHLTSTAGSGEAGRDCSRDRSFLLLTGQEREKGVQTSRRIWQHSGGTSLEALVREEAICWQSAKGASALGAGGWLALQKSVEQGN